MTCRHKPGDPDCSSHPSNPYNPSNIAAELPKTPDSKNYEIEDAQQVGQNLVLKVRYPNCRSCAYEGRKVMVFLGVTPLHAMRWREIDPHFKDPARKIQPTEAPPPAARFPASVDGWNDALDYARAKLAAVDPSRPRK
jgi:hypothetical protein